MKRTALVSLTYALLASFIWLPAAAQDVAADKTDFDKLVADTHAASLKLREKSLRKTIASDGVFPGGVWGENLWCLAALYLNEKTEEANARLLKRAQTFTTREPAKPGTPAKKPNEPWTFFSIPDYVRTLCLFHAKSPHFPGRLKPETEAAMKEALFRWVHHESRFLLTGTDDLLLLQGTENQDLIERSCCYLINTLLQDDPAFRERKLRDEHTVAEHAAAYTAFYRAWAGSRAGVGLWIEIGAAYQKYSWPALFNLCELAPDPVIRKRFGLLLDLAFVEEEQISVHGRRGGGLSRSYPGSNQFETYKNLLYAEKGRAAGSSHSRVIEASRYQLPPEAIYLRYRAFPAAEPFVIRNRVPGELAPRDPKGDPRPPGWERYRADSSLVNYAYRTPHYQLGSTLMSPTRNYSGISRQERVCGMIFEGPGICSVRSSTEQGRGGRPQNPYWSVQHENVLILQRIAPNPHMGSYSTARVGFQFSGKALKKVETKDWIFAGNGQAFVGVKFLDGAYEWDEKGEVALPANFKPAQDQLRILLIAGDIKTSKSFEEFQTTVLASQSKLRVTPRKVEYEFGPARTRLEVTAFDPKAANKFTLPLINGEPVDLHPGTTYQSPYLNSEFGSEKISVSVGPVQRLLNFSE
jgi:hypothetical protein